MNFFYLSLPQIAIAIVSLYFLYSGIRRFFRRERSQTIFKLLMTLVIWMTILLFALFPKLSHLATKTLGFGENLNTLIFIGFIMLFIIVTKLLSIVERIERNVSEIVRKEALSKLEK